MVEAVVSSTDWSQFGGYAAPAYTQIPNEFLDQHMADLTDPELRVLLYIMRRTLGFHQVSCAASLPEISRGTVVGGVARDRGTGLAISTIQNALQGLLDKRLILRVRQRRPDGGDAASMYALNVQGGGTGSRWGGVPAPGGGGYRETHPSTLKEKKGVKKESSDRQNVPVASPPSPSAVAPASDVAPGSPQALAASALGFGPQAYPWIQALQQRLEAAGLSDITDIHLEAVCCRAWHEANHPGAVHVWQNLLRSWVQRTIRHPLPDQYQEEESAPAPTGPVDLAEEESGISAFDAMREAALGRLGEATWQRWFQPLWARPVSDGVLPIICPDGFSRDWFHDRLDGVVRECLLSAGFPALTPSYEEAP